MNLPWGPFALTAVAGAMVALPLTPALLELRQRRDAAAIPTQQHNADTRNFALAFRDYVRPLLPELAECARAGALRTVALPGGIRAILAGNGTPTEFVSGARIDTLLLCYEKTILPDRLTITGDVYANDTLVGGQFNVFRAALAERDLFLGEGSYVLRWAHAEDAIYAARGTTLYGRASAGGAIHLAPGCRFERMRARRIVTDSGDGDPLPVVAVYSDFSTVDFPLLRRRILDGSGLAAGEVVDTNIIAVRDLRIGEGCHVLGSIKGHGDVEVARGAKLEGSVVAAGVLRIAAGTVVRGPVLSEREIHIESNVQIGGPECPSTVSAPRIHIAPGVALHGTVWAREGGYIGA
jgi:cytoskeletal protein CcmA (bactofilin family)